MQDKLTRNFENVQYFAGFGNHCESEAIPDSIPKGQNSPQRCPYNLVAEQLSGTAFTAPRAANQRSWLYRIRPCVTHKPFAESKNPLYAFIQSNFFDDSKLVITPNQLRWEPLPIPSVPTTFLEGFVTIAGAGDPSIKSGIAIHLYSANKSMENQAFYNSDGDFLIVPQLGTLYITTEFGLMTVKPREICVMPRGIKFQVEVTEPIRGYICEVFKGHFKIPDLGPIGANGLANPRDFEIPKAFYENTEGSFTILNKYMGKIFEADIGHSPFNVVSWHGNYVPYKYNLDLFCVMNTVSFDHPDPSIFTVISCPTDEPGTATCDFAIFPPRWMVGEHTFRPPYYHRNVMSEFMGNIAGKYDAKTGGFGPGCSSLHNMMTAHGPETSVFEKWSTCELKPERYPYDNLAFMFETSYFIKLTKFVMDDKVEIDKKYYQCWDGLDKLKLDLSKK